MNEHAVSKHKCYLEGINLKAIRLSAHRHIKLGQKWSECQLTCWWQSQVKLVLLVCCVCIFRQFNNVKITLQWVLVVVSGWITLLPVRFCVMQWKCLFNTQNDIKTLKKWMAEVDVFLKEEWPALGDSEALEKQLEQCTVSITCLLGRYSIPFYELSLYRCYTNDYSS